MSIKSGLSFGEKIFEFLTSLKLAVIVIILLGVVSAVGTIIEAKYDAFYAQQVVYKSVWMYGVLGLLCVNLIAVMIDRWPWKVRHIGFLMAHVGIIFSLMGAYLTQKSGLDGSLSIDIGKSNRFVQLNDRELSVYASLAAGEFRPLIQRPVSFIVDRPTPESPFQMKVGDETLEVLEYLHFAFSQSKVEATDKKTAGPALRFHLQNSNVSVTDWVVAQGSLRPGEKDLGPAKVILASKNYQPNPLSNEIVLSPENGQLRYRIHSKKAGRITGEGLASEGDLIQTGWMGLELRLIRYLPLAEEKIEFIESDHDGPLVNSAIKIRFRGEEQWLGLNRLLRFFADDQMFVLSYSNRRVDLGFEVFMDRFEVGTYQGTTRPATYASYVTIPGSGSHEISMNEPLEHKGLKLYQASFTPDPETNQPVASILSVNYDPGRPLKYIGALILVLGALHLFYFNKTTIFGIKVGASPAARKAKDKENS